MRRALTALALGLPLAFITAACDGDPVTTRGTITVDGTVHEQGNPSVLISGADVRFGTPGPGGGEPDWVETTTDAQGAYELQFEAPAGCAASDSADVRYEADATGYVPFTSMILSLSQKVSCGSGAQTFDIPLQPEEG